VRTSWIVDPADGRLPYTPAGHQAYVDALRKARNSWDGPENRPLGERCILGFGSTAGPPMLNVLYNNNYQIVQSKDAVAIVVEMNHDARIIRLTNDKHLPSHMRPWMGDSIGHWEGDTLVIQTVSIRGGIPIDRTGAALSDEARVLERIRKTDDRTLQSDITIDDPVAFTGPWKVTRRYTKRQEKYPRMENVSSLENQRNPLVNGQTGVLLDVDASSPYPDDIRRFAVPRFPPVKK
jgi:hypothetical protein